MALEFVVEVADLKEALKALVASLARGRQVESQCFDVSASAEEITLETEGFSYILPGEVRSPGSARLPQPIVQGLRRLARLLTEKDVTISIVPGHFKLGPTNLASPEITLLPTRGRIADLPIDAPFLEIPLLGTRFTPEEIEQSGLTRRLQEARQQAESLNRKGRRHAGAVGSFTGSSSRLCAGSTEVAMPGSNLAVKNQGEIPRSARDDRAGAEAGPTRERTLFAKPAARTRSP